jgi:ABC-2 type transport system ATP-binding protein
MALRVTARLRICPSLQPKRRRITAAISAHPDVYRQRNAVAGPAGCALPWYQPRSEKVSILDGEVSVSSVRWSASEGRRDGPALVADGLTKRFGDRYAFRDVSFEVGHGEVFGFLGPNGAGKTTTVRTLGTLIAPSSGSATVAGMPLQPENGVEIRRRIAIMPEAPGLYLRLSVAENLECFAGLYEAPDPGARIDEALGAVGLRDRAGDLCGALSKGLRQRVALARALLSDPTVLFLDEPTSGLDPVAARAVHELIDDLRDRGVTIFLTTHRLDEAERLCDRVAILNTTLRTIGRPDELRERLFAKSLAVRTRVGLADPDEVFGGRDGVETWREESPGVYVVAVSDATIAAPEVIRALVAAGADVLSVSETRHSLQDVYLELISEDVELEAGTTR